MSRRRRILPRRRTAQALQRGHCMFATLGGCSDDVKPQPLTWDALTLCCDQHLPRLIELRHDLAEVRRLRRYLGARFAA